MQDIETNSLWSQVSGKAIQGEEEGKELRLFNAQHSTYGEFKRLYPNGILLRKDIKGDAGSNYNKYFQSNDKLGIFGRVDNFKRLKGKDIVYGIRLADGEVAFSKELLIKNGFSIYLVSDFAIIITYNSHAKSVAAFKISKPSSEIYVENNDIVFKTHGNTKDRWDAQTGNSKNPGNKDLEPFPVVTSYWFAWASFFPGSELIK